MASQFSSWDSYFWEPGGPVLRNLYGERDGAALAQREYSETNAQQFDIERGAVSIPRTYDAEHVRAIHAQLFGNVYEWAGEYRTVGISKNLSQFAHPADVPHYLNDASRIVRGSEWSTMNRDQFAASAAEVFAYVNQAHPFREGNGRTAKLFMQHVAELSPYRLDYSPAVSGVTPELWNQASMLSGPDRDKYEPQPATLVPVFRAMAVERPPAPQASKPDAARDVTRDRSPYRASFPRPATEATRPGTDAGTGKRPPQRPGQRYDVGRD
ncbi:MAG TPA: Fic family protein [Propioniciclava sp.]|uniref:Fic/DOC family protein n=2 Tax=Actinomycetes TaxID=1760 RepID=UPI002BE51096|nr:Fic family protein [Propioniciclava sp.]HRL81602.1 Fic family protein [Propioniciclava sp.]